LIKPFTDVAFSITTDTMSSQLTSLITVFDGQNYGTWSKAMRAFLMAQGLWTFTDGTTTEPLLPVDPTPPKPLASNASQQDRDIYDVADAEYKVNKAEYDVVHPLYPALLSTWQKGNDMALGNITLRLSLSLQQCIDPTSNAEQIWDWLKVPYGSATLPSVYRNLKEALSICFNPNQHPGPQFDKMAAAFGRLGLVSFGSGYKAKKVNVTDLLQALIAMAAIPSKWENMIPIIANGYEPEDLDLNTVQDMIVTQYENETN
jgi:hypothetical protein